jgi:hypothetical protein
MVVQRGFKKPPSYFDPRLMKSPVGHFFNVMTYGRGAMADYSAQVPVADRWRIAAYIRALQLSQTATSADVAPAQPVASHAPEPPGGEMQLAQRPPAPENTEAK